MKWITRSNVKVDRVACPWLIRRFVDSQAEFLFVPEDQLLDTARKKEAIPFDATRFASKGIASFFRAVSRSWSSGTKRNSACESTKRRMSQGQATRSTLTLLRVIHFMLGLFLRGLSFNPTFRTRSSTHRPL